MRLSTMAWIWALGSMLAVFGSCARYDNGQGSDECVGMGDCNPGQTCGSLVACVDGRCDPTSRVQIPCAICETDEDCGEGARCAQGSCVAEASCQTVSECWEYQRECPGWLACREEWCRYTCHGDESCEADGDCAVVGQGCCCNEVLEDFAAIRRDHLEEFQARPECWVVDCPPSPCRQPPSLKAVCQSGRCRVVEDPIVEIDACRVDADCVEVPVSCPSCDCHNGYGERAIHRDHEAEYLANLEAECALVGACMPGPFGAVDACTDRPPVCEAGRCTFPGESCRCDPVWDPVCAGAGGVVTFPNDCAAACAGYEGVLYYGRCECQIDCDCGDFLYHCAACAANGRTYSCGEFEARCNGTEALYPGACDPSCDACGLLGRPAIPVCGFDFFDYSDMCYADCLGRAFLHYGACETGEGQLCGTIAGLGCRAGQACMLDLLVPDAAGRCVREGSCHEPEHCERQMLGHAECEGAWFCQDHACDWVCLP